MALVASFNSLARANEHALVILAMERPCWLHEEDTGDFHLYTGMSDLPAVQNELSLYEAEQDARLNEPSSLTLWQIHKPGLWWALLWVSAMLAAFAWQGYQPAIVDFGMSSSLRLIEKHEYWRPLTAQFLHADIEHLIGNILFGLLYGILAARTLGAKLAWLLILISGFCANVMTSAFHYPDAYTSIGASTAVFGAWGLLTGCGVYIAFRSPDHEPWAQVIIPLGGGIALLGWLGMGGGDSSIDVLGHVFGFFSGGVLGALTAAVKLHRLRRIKEA